MSLRKRYEHQIVLTERLSSARNTIERAIEECIWRGGKLDLSWFTDDQIADIRAEMISREWSNYRFTRQQRQALATMAERRKARAA